MQALVCLRRSKRHPAITARGGVLFFLLLSAVACGQPPQGATVSGRDELRIGFAGANPASNDFGAGQFVTLLTVEGLTYGAYDGRATPRLADSFKWASNGRALRVNLRPAARFHDGTLVTSSAVAESLRQTVENPADVALYPALADVTSVNTDGNSQVVVNLRRPNAFLPEDLSTPIRHGKTQAGTGAYRVLTRDKTELVLERFDDYYLGRPAIRRIVVRPFDALRTAWSSLLRGEVDMVSDVQPDAVEFLRTDNVRVISFSRGYQYLVAFNSRRAPLASPAVRRALNIAVNRDQLIRDVLKGRGQPATGPLWPKHWAYDASTPAYVYQPAVAESMLDAAGLKANRVHGKDAPPARLHFTCLVPAGFSTLERLALTVQKQLYDVGVDMRFDVVSAQEYDTRIRQGNFDAVLLDLLSGPAIARAYTFWASASAFRGLNVFGYEDPEAQRLFDLLRESTNEAATRSAMQRLQRVLEDDPPALFLAWSERTRAIRSEFGIPQDPDRDPMLTLWQWKPSALLAASQ
jgi:peptide/nickel transport system substrate-binding protein